MKGWETLKQALKVVYSHPLVDDQIQEWRDGQTPAFQKHLRWLESIEPAAQAEIAHWLNPETEIQVTEAIASDSAETTFLVIARLWERFLAVGHHGGPEAQLRWLSEKSREERLLLTRLSKRITLPIS